MLRLRVYSDAIIISHATYMSDYVTTLPKPGKAYEVYRLTPFGVKHLGNFTAEKTDGGVKAWKLHFSKYRHGILVQYEGEYAWYKNNVKILVDDRKRLDKLIEKYGNLEIKGNTLTIIKKGSVESVGTVILKTNEKPVFEWEIKDGMVVIKVDGVEQPLIPAPKPPNKIETIVFNNYGSKIVTIKTPKETIEIVIAKNGFKEITSKSGSVWFYEGEEEKFQIFYEALLNFGSVGDTLKFFENL